MRGAPQRKFAWPICSIKSRIAQQPVRLPKAETTWRALLQDGDLMAESQDLSLLSSTGPKRRGDQSQNGNEKWRHRGKDDDLTNRVKDCIFNPEGVFGMHRFKQHPDGLIDGFILETDPERSHPRVSRTLPQLSPGESCQTFRFLVDRGELHAGLARG